MGTILPMRDLISRVDVTPQLLFEKAKEAHVEEALVIGWDADGEFWLGGTSCDTGRILILLARAQRQIIEGID